jgi:hypothetical protein
MAPTEAGWPWLQPACITRDIIAVMMIARIAVCLKKERVRHELEPELRMPHLLPIRCKIMNPPNG